MASSSRGRQWCFTLNNYTTGETQLLSDLGASEHVEYLVFGREVGESGTPHLQGFIRFHDRKTFSSAKSLISPRCFIEIAKGTPSQNRQYCTKDGDFEEFGTCPVSRQGKRNDWEKLKEHVLELNERPPRRSLVVLFPALMARYEHAVWSYIDCLLPAVRLTDSTPREGWQSDLDGLIEEDPDPRTIEFIVDPIGNSGKTWFCQYILTKYPNDAQYLRAAKRDDMAHAIDPIRTIFLIDVPRRQMEFLPYAILESLKDRMVFSPKYQSGLKLIPRVPHVIVFCNEYPNPNALSADRVSVTQLSYATVQG